MRDGRPLQPYLVEDSPEADRCIDRATTGPPAAFLGALGPPPRWLLDRGEGRWRSAGFGGRTPPDNQSKGRRISYVARNARRTTLRGRLREQANTAYQIEFFANARPGVTTASGGQTPIGSVDVTTNGGRSGRFKFSFGSLLGRTFFSAPATSAAGDSESSKALPD